MMDKICYHDGVEVKIGDYVSIRFWLILRRKGQITYLPGYSRKNEQMEYDGLKWVAITTLNGQIIISTPIEPDTNRLFKSVKFLERGDLTNLREVGPDDDLDDW